MKLISHRGNIFGKRETGENDPEHIEEALSKSYIDMCEVDVWLLNNQWYFGHDEPYYLIDEKFILDRQEQLLLHTKNLSALSTLITMQKWFENRDLHFFWHEDDRYTITSQNVIIAYPSFEGNHDCILMAPERCNYSVNTTNCWGICTDVPYKFRSNNVENT